MLIPFSYLVCLQSSFYRLKIHADPRHLIIWKSMQILIILSSENPCRSSSSYHLKIHADPRHLIIWKSMQILVILSSENPYRSSSSYHLKIHADSHHLIVWKPMQLLFYLWLPAIANVLNDVSMPSYHHYQAGVETSLNIFVNTRVHYWMLQAKHSQSSPLSSVPILLLGFHSALFHTRVKWWILSRFYQDFYLKGKSSPPRLLYPKLYKTVWLSPTARFVHKRSQQPLKRSEFWLNNMIW